VLLDFTEINSDHAFEKFAQLFLELLDHKVTRVPAVGPDGGVDIICEQHNRYGQIGYKWLVSCKHYARSRKSIGTSVDQANEHKLREHRCNGFMFVYSTAVTEGLRASVERVAQNIGASYYFFTPWEIENTIISSSRFYPLMNQFFPISHERIIGKVGIDDVECCLYGGGLPDAIYAVYTKNKITQQIKVQVIGECCIGDYIEHLQEAGIEYGVYILREHFYPPY
jgi:hypothetical protein